MAVPAVVIGIGKLLLWVAATIVGGYAVKDWSDNRKFDLSASLDPADYPEDFSRAIHFAYSTVFGAPLMAVVSWVNNRIQMVDPRLRGPVVFDRHHAFDTRLTDIEPQMIFYNVDLDQAQDPIVPPYVEGIKGQIDFSVMGVYGTGSAPARFLNYFRENRSASWLYKAWDYNNREWLDADNVLRRLTIPDTMSPRFVSLAMRNNIWVDLRNDLVDAVFSRFKTTIGIASDMDFNVHTPYSFNTMREP